MTPWYSTMPATVIKTRDVNYKSRRLRRVHWNPIDHDTVDVISGVTYGRGVWSTFKLDKTVSESRVVPRCLDRSVLLKHLFLTH